MVACLAEPTVPRPISPSAGINLIIDVRAVRMPVARNAIGTRYFRKVRANERGVARAGELPKAKTEAEIMGREIGIRAKCLMVRMLTDMGKPQREGDPMNRSPDTTDASKSLGEAGIVQSVEDLAEKIEGDDALLGNAKQTRRLVWLRLMVNPLTDRYVWSWRKLECQSALNIDPLSASKIVSGGENPHTNGGPSFHL